MNDDAYDAIQALLADVQKQAPELVKFMHEAFDAESDDAAESDDDLEADVQAAIASIIGTGPPAVAQSPYGDGCVTDG